ncbi:MAG: stage II sporulation protein P [Clostridiales bacterium]|jgi:stage II sporulation protein P|nr:stage II sporulation protein P [Clostridiales bacterium]
MLSKKAVIKARAILALMLLCGAVTFSLPFARASETENEIIEFDDYIFVSSEKKSDYAKFFDYTAIEIPPLQIPPLSEEYISRLADFHYLTQNIFLTDPRTIFLETDINTDEFLAKDFRIDTAVEGPQLLIFHAHSREMYEDSDHNDPFTGILGVGRALAETLETQYGISVLHHTERFDVIDGIPNREGAYERLAPAISQILADNPSIQVVIDLHRDGVGAHVQPMVSEINGQRAAQIMLVNGLSRRFRNGEIIPVTYLPNPYQRENLAFSFNLQLAANQLYPGFARRIYLLEFRYSLHMHPNSILLEVGAQNNTFQEALNAVPPIADILASVVIK